jgi:PAS domain S-box-containing protein
LAHQGKRQTATALLTGAGYMRLKEIYAGGMEKTVNAANGLIERETRQLHTLYRWAAAASAVGVLLLLAIWFFADQAVRSWGLKRREAWDEILKAREELEDRVKQRTASLLSANEQLEHEILEHKRAEERIRESEAHYHGIFEYSNDIIYLLNLNGTINSLSPAFERITGWTAEEWIGKPFAPIIHPDDLSDADTVFQKALSGESIPTFRLRLARKSGQYFDADLSITPLGHDMVMGVARDVSERTKTEAQLVEQLEELRRWHDTTLDREGRILDLKHEVNDLLSQTGKHPRYPSAESADPQENK